MPEWLVKQQSERMKANPVKYWQGKKRGAFNSEWRKKLSDSQKLAYQEGRRKVSDTSLNSITNLNKGKTGKAHPKWTEQKKRPFYQAIRTLNQYRTWRNNIYKRDNYTCQMCGKHGGNLEADHNPKRFIDIIRDNNVTTIDEAISCNELWQAKGRTLCKPCHTTTF